MKPLPAVLLVLVLLCACQGKPYQYTDPHFHVSVSYPGSMDLTTDQAKLDRAQGVDPAKPRALDDPRLVFILTTPQLSQLTVAVHHLPADVKLSPEEYYQASTAVELKGLGAKIVEPKSDVVINGRTFQRVGFTVTAGEQPLRVRIYQYLDVKSGRILVATPTVNEDLWDQEIPEIEPVIDSLKVDW
jgi:hypothetical protein